MPKFVFRLDPVLGVRRRKEELTRQELAAADARKRACEDRLAETRRLLAESLEQEPEGAGFDLKASLRLDCYREHLGKRRAEEVRALKRREKDVDERRARVVEAGRARAVLERLKEKQFADFRAREAVRETRELDDTGTRLFLFQRVKRKGGE